MKMGYAEVDITPKESVTMVGFNRDDNASKGILDCLLAQVVLWEDTGLSCIVTIDNIGFNQKDADYLRELIGKIINESIEKVMLAFSHTHSAPNTDVERSYYEFLCDRVCSAVVKAKESMNNVTVGWGNAEADIGINRRDPSEKIDRRVGILKVCDEQKEKTELIILRITAHANVLKRDNYLVSSDFFGSVRQAFKDKYRCPVMIVQGSAGNISPKYYCSKITPIDANGIEYINSPTARNDIALELINSCNKVFDTIKVTQDINISAYSRYLKLKSRVPGLREAQMIAEEAIEKCGIDGEQWLAEIKYLNHIHVDFQEENLEVQYFTIGNWCLCGIPNETMTEFAIDIEKMLSNQFFYFNGYTNGCSSYFPTEEEYDMGGYEVYWAMLLYFKDYKRVYPYERDSFSKVKKFVVENSFS